MDPNSTLKLIFETLECPDATDERWEACRSLQAWLKRGGFEPHWAAFPDASQYFKSRHWED